MIRNDKELIVVGDRVLVHVEEGEERTKVGLYLPSSAMDSQAVQGGTIVATGPGQPMPAFDANTGDDPWKEPAREARFVPMQARRGDYALFFSKGRGGDHLRGRPVSRRPADGDPRPRARIVEPRILLRGSHDVR